MDERHLENRERQGRGRMEREKVREKNLEGERKAKKHGMTKRKRYACKEEKRRGEFLKQKEEGFHMLHLALHI